MTNEFEPESVRLPAPNELRSPVLPMKKKAWAARSKKCAVLARVNEPRKSCHGVRKAPTEVAAYADCTESQMVAMFGWTAPKMPAHDIAPANREELACAAWTRSWRSIRAIRSTISWRCPAPTRPGGENRVVMLWSNS